MNPEARKDQLVIQDIGDETIIYDERRDHIHRLNRTAAIVWRHCNGHNTITDLVGVLQAELSAPATEDTVWLALDRLEKERLLQDKLTRPASDTQVTRRQALRKVAVLGGATLLLPVVQSMIAPTPAMAASIPCAKRGQTYNYIPGANFRPCCAGLNPTRGYCVDRTGRR